MTALSRSVLIVEDEFLISTHFTLQVEDMGLPVCGVADTAADAIESAAIHRPAVVLMDVRLRGMADGIDAAMQIHELVGSKVIFITGSREQSTIERIKLDHPFAILFKPIADDLLKATIREALNAVV